ncbi:MAG: response regulator transcription factor [Eubacterium sp.]|nr:response regulator transcription factor [Eubacterium sp.]
MRILIVEDEISLADLVAERLRKERYIVDVSNDGEDGLFNALSGIYDLILLDIMLPGKDGMEILREIKENNIQSKVIMLTAKDQLEDKLKGFAEGANDYVPKPFHIDEVVARVNAQLRIEKAVSNTREYGDIILDYSIPAVINKNTDESIKINNKEFQLLEFFMISHDQVLSKETIFDRIWGMENDLMSNNVEAYISFVRRKLKMLDSKVAINTIRNMGYKMEYMDEGTK